MKTAVMGAGAIGCYYGAMLARAGNEVALVGREQHVEAMRREGLRLEAKSLDVRLPVQASTQPAILRGAGLILFCVKSPDTEAAGKAMAPHVARDAHILSLQNGVDNAERLSAVLNRDVIPAVVYAATEMAGPGHVKHNGRGELVIGASSASAQVANVLRAAGIPVEISDNVAGTLWAKLIMNCAYNALSAITQLPYGRLVAQAGVPAVMQDVAKAAKVERPGDMHEAARRIAQTMPAQFSSTAQDLARGKPTEIDYLNGFVVRKGDALGVATPANRVLHALVKSLSESAPPSARRRPAGQ
jgi:2-dehydropantoate 2-reductase